MNDYSLNRENGKNSSWNSLLFWRIAEILARLLYAHQIHWKHTNVDWAKYRWDRINSLNRYIKTKVTFDIESHRKRCKSCSYWKRHNEMQRNDIDQYRGQKNKTSHELARWLLLFNWQTCHSKINLFVSARRPLKEI
jgi:hypothetical protein